MGQSETSEYAVVGLELLATGKLNRESNITLLSGLSGVKKFVLGCGRSEGTDGGRGGSLGPPVKVAKLVDVLTMEHRARVNVEGFMLEQQLPKQVAAEEKEEGKGNAL